MESFYLYTSTCPTAAWTNISSARTVINIFLHSGGRHATVSSETSQPVSITSTTSTSVWYSTATSRRATSCSMMPSAAASATSASPVWWASTTTQPPTSVSLAPGASSRRSTPSATGPRARPTSTHSIGVLVLEVVTGRRSLSAADVPFPLLPDWVWWLHGQGRLLEAVDDELISCNEAELHANDATRLLLLGLACSNPKPSDRPSMAEVVQVIGKSMPPPNVPLARPAVLWPPEGELELWDKSDDDLTGVGHREGTESHGGFVISIGSLESPSAGLVRYGPCE